MTYRVVKIEPCPPPVEGQCRTVSEGREVARWPCIGCRGDGTRMVDVCEVVNDDQSWMWVEVKP